MKTDIVEKYNKIKQERFPDDISQPDIGTQLLIYLQIKGILTKDEVDDILEDGKKQYEKFLEQFRKENRF